MPDTYRVGIDLGGTKTEIILLHKAQTLLRLRQPTPSHSYQAILASITGLLDQAFERCPADVDVRIGIGMPGAITSLGLVKNSNTLCLNGKPFQHDLQQRLGRSVQVMNDANCFTLSEAVDGAAAVADCVFGVILGTGVGGGLVLQQQPRIGVNAIAGEWGHTPLPATAPRLKGDRRRCYCGQYDCIETYLCGVGLSLSLEELCGERLSGEQIAVRITEGNKMALTCYQHYQHQLAASLAVVINILDPEVIVLGGGLSNLPQLAEQVQPLLNDYVFSDQVNTRLVGNQHGDSSGVRGAAWL